MRNDATEAVPAPSNSPRINYWIFNYEPQWEAASKEVQTLADWFDPIHGTRTVSLNVHDKTLSLSGRDRRLPAMIGLPALPLLMRMARSTDVNHVFASAAERILTPRFARLERTMLTVTKGTPDLAKIEKSAAVLKALRYVVVESERYRDLLLQLGLKPERVHLIYPGLATEPYRAVDGPFTILFATSPRKHALLSRGIHMMVRAAERLPDVRFVLIWRRDAEEGRKIVREAGVSNVDIVAGQVDDMKAVYDSAHTVILPALESESLKPCPHSGLHALAHGKPVLVSHAASFSAIVERESCGRGFRTERRSAVRGDRPVARQLRTLPTQCARDASDAFLQRRIPRALRVAVQPSARLTSAFARDGAT